LRGFRGTLIALAVAGAGLASAPAALAVTTIAAKPDSTWETNGRVLAIAESAGIVYIGGTFTSVDDKLGTVVVRNHMAAIDEATGAVVTTFDPAPSGAVRDIMIGPTGTIYVSGDFTTIAGKARKRMAALNTSGAALAFKANANATVYGMTVLGSTIYAGGNFTTLNGVARTRLVAVDATTGALAAWAPAADGEVTSMATNGTAVYAGGLFTHIGASTQNHLASLSASTGAVQAWAYHPSYPVEGMAATASMLYLAGGGAGGRVGALSTAGGSFVWEISVNGNVQQVGIFGSQLIAGGHFDDVCDPGTNCANAIVRHKVLAADAATGALNTVWHPSVNSTLGVFAVATAAAKVFIGGDFTKAGGLAQAHYAQFSGTP
jgi:trimeric autotransporter adhesin